MSEAGSRKPARLVRGRAGPEPASVRSVGAAMQTGKRVIFWTKPKVGDIRISIRGTRPWPRRSSEKEGEEIRLSQIGAEPEGGKDFFIWIRRNLLKSPDSDE